MIEKTNNGKMTNEWIMVILGILFSVVGYFLRETMDQLKDAKRDISDLKLRCSENKSQLEILKNDHTNKTEALNDKMDELKSVMRDLSKEIKSLTIEIAKKKEN